MIPEPITIDGRTGTVVYLDAQWHPVSAERATMAKVLFDDGTASFFFAEEPSKPEGIGGLTRKFDAAAHPRGEDGRFIEASQPRVFSRPSDVGESHSGWANDPVRWAWIDKETGKPGGRLLTGEPIPRAQIPPKLYHVTTNAPAVEESGVLLGLLDSGGLGGGQAQGVSFTSSKEDAVVIQRELRRAVRVARGEAGIDAIKEWAQQDELVAGLPEGALSEAVDYAMQGWDVNSKSSLGRTDPPNPPEEEERIRRSLVGDALNAYLQTREETAAKALGQKEWPYSVPILKNPILFGQQKHLAKLDVKNVQILETDAEDIPADALVTTGSDKFLHEVRVYADVPRRRKKVAFDENKIHREPAGTSEGGQFASTGKSGVSASDPLLAVQAKAGIAAVEKLLPEAIKTADYTSGEPQSWDDVSSEGQDAAYYKFIENYEESDLDMSSLNDEIKDDLEKDNQKVLDEAVEDVERRLSNETFVDEFGAQRALPIGGDYYITDAEGHVQSYVPPATPEEQFYLKKTLDIETLDYGEGVHEHDGTVKLDWDKLRFTNGQELTEEQKEIVKDHWDTAYEKAFEAKLQEEYESDSYMEKMSEMRDESARESWDNLSDSEKMQYFEDLSNRSRGDFRRQPREGEPDTWVTGVETGKHSDENYARTHAIALKLAELRTEQLLEERGLTGAKAKPEYEIREVTFVNPNKTEYHVHDKATGKLITGTDTEGGAISDAEEWARIEQLRGNIKTPQMISDVWDQWKRSSSEGLSMSVQLAAARELGGHHRMTPEEVAEAESEARPYGGIPVLQAYVRAQWETTQLVMDKAKADKIEVYRGLMLPGNMVNATTRVFIDEAGNRITTSNITTGINKVGGKPYVGFDFDGEHFVVEKERRAPTSIKEVEPAMWHQVDDAIKAKVKEEWDKDAYDTLVDPEVAALDPERGKKLIDNLYKKLGDDGRFELMHTYAAQGRITLPKFEPRPYETDEEAIDRRLTTYLGQYGGKTYVRLPDLILQRSGAQSTTGTPSVANSWGGVGNLPDNPTRVVIRIEAPPTSVFSLPVYGQNSQEEHETVVLGTKDKWLWDAWQNRAPIFESHPITGPYLPKELMPKKPLEMTWPESVDYDTQQALKAEKKPLVIDMQAEDRGKPHWMSSVDWAKVEQDEQTEK
jgi:hypothetical protein